jgi:hypothetical protein
MTKAQRANAELSDQGSFAKSVVRARSWRKLTFEGVCSLNFLPSSPGIVSVKRKKHDT